MSDKPIHTIRAGGVKATIWQNQGEGGNTFLTTTITRSYRDGNGEWKETNTFMAHQLPQLELVARKSYEFTQMGRESSRDQQVNGSGHEGQNTGQASNDNSAEGGQQELSGMAQGDGEQTHAERVSRERGSRRR
jgi:hypothetical protein